MLPRPAALVLVVSCVSLGAAATPWDIYGAGDRAAGLGGAVSASSRDGFATFYNPAALTLNPRGSLSLTFGGRVHGFSASGADQPALDRAVAIPNYVGLDVAATLPFRRLFPGLDREVTLGLALGLPHGGLSTSSATAVPPAQPYLPLLSGWNERTMLMIGLAAEILPGRLSAGLSLVGFTAASATVSLGAGPTPAGSINVSRDAAVAVAAGLLWHANRYLDIALTFRDEQILVVSSRVDAAAAAGSEWASYSISGTAFFMPRQFGLGLAAQLTSRFSLALDTQFVQSSRLADAPPLAQVTTDPGGSDAVTSQVPVVQARDVFVVRTGLEWRDLWEILSLRLGYAWHPRFLDGDQPNVLLDADRHIISGGFTVTVGAGSQAPRGGAFGIGGYFQVIVLGNGDHRSAAGPVSLTGVSAGGGMAVSYQF